MNNTTVIRRPAGWYWQAEGIGYLPVSTSPKDDAYKDSFGDDACNALVRRHVPLNAVVLEAGCEDMTVMHKDTKLDALCLWDGALQCRPDAHAYIRSHGLPQWVFVGSPIYKDEEHAMQSPQWQQGAHCWFFTRIGLLLFMARLGYMCYELVTEENPAPTHSTEMFAFKLTCV